RCPPVWRHGTVNAQEHARRSTCSMQKDERDLLVSAAVIVRRRWQSGWHFARPVAGVIVAILVVFAIGLTSRALGGITISFGSFNSTAWPSGPDYATDVLADPWDMSNPEDIGLDPNETVGWNSFSVANCVAGGTT